MADDVDEVDGHVAGLAANLSIRADAAQVVAVADAGANDPGVLDPGQRQVGGFATHYLAETHVAVDEQHGAAVADHSGVGVDPQQIVADVVHVRRDHADPVAVMALEIGGGQVRGYLPGCRLLAACGHEDPGDEFREPAVIDQHVIALPRFLLD